MAELVSERHTSSALHGEQKTYAINACLKKYPKNNW